MISFPNPLCIEINDVVSRYKMRAQEEPKYFKLVGSADHPQIKIRRIIESINLFPIIAVDPVSRDFCFTVVPFAVPNFFKLQPLEDRHFSTQELQKLFNERLFTSFEDNRIIKNPCDGINESRLYVKPALNQLLTELLSDACKKDQAIVEIGSGVGYAFAPHLKDRMIRTQLDADQGLSLAREGEAVYRLSINDFSKFLTDSDKSLPFVFALKVFDVLSQKERKEALAQLSKVQKTGDKLMILLDSPPCIHQGYIDEIEDAYPGCGVYPYIQYNHQTCAPLRFILVPDALANRARPKAPEIGDMDKADRNALIDTNQRNPRQEWLKELHEKHHLQVIGRVTFYEEQMKAALDEAGYQVKRYYDASFIQGIVPENCIQQDDPFIYKSVSDSFTIREWDLTGEERGWLGKRSITLPDRFTEEFGKNLPKGEHLLGAEIFVLEATKG